MRTDSLALFRCPACSGALTLHDAEPAGAVEIATGRLACAACATSHPIAGHVPRFVPAENYAANFGFQWNEFRRTQLDSYSGTRISADRFFGSTGWRPEDLAGKRVLDVGCGAGRFAEVALGCGAEVVAVDYSSAVDACWQNHRASNRLTVVQGDIYRLPFAPGSFDFVYCLGVLQHTPDVHAAFSALPRQLRPGGRLAVDVYARTWRNVVNGKYLVRPITKRMSADRLFPLVRRWVPRLFPLSRAIGRVPLLGRKLRYVLPLSNYDGIHPLDETQLREWAVLDTFDMLAPAHDHPQDAPTLRRWFAEAQLRDVEVFKHGHLVARGAR